MRNLLSADLMRLRHSHVLWLCMAYELYQGLMIFYNASVMAQQGTSRWAPSFQFLWLGGIVFAVYCSFFVSGEYAEGGVRRKVVSGASRQTRSVQAWRAATGRPCRRAPKGGFGARR